MQNKNIQREGFVAPNKERDAEVFETNFPNVPAMIAEARAKIDRTNRLNILVDFANFIGTASLLERKYILNEIIDKTNIEGDCDVSKLEDAAVDFTKAIEYEAHPARCKCEACAWSRSDEHFDRSRAR